MERSRDRPVASRDDTLAVVRVACVEVLCIFDETRGVGGNAVSGVVARPPVPLDVVSGRVGMVERSGRGRGALHQCSAVVDFGESRVVSCRVGQWREGGVRGVGVEVAGVAWSEGRWRVFVGGGRGAPPKWGRIHTEFPRRRWRRAQDVEDRLEVSEVRVVARSIFGYRWVSVDRGSSVSGGRWRKSWWWRVVGLVVGCRWVSVEGRRRRVVGGGSVCV